LVWKYKYYKELLKLKKKGFLSDSCIEYLNANNKNILIQIANVSSAIDSIESIESSNVELTDDIINLSSILDSLYNIGGDNIKNEVFRKVLYY